MEAERMGVAYMRCNGGDYFRGESIYCPLDGWSSDESRQLAEALEKISAENLEVTIASLTEAGLPWEVLQRTIVIEFGSAGSMFEAITPRGYVVDGKWKPIETLGLGFK
jgi:hypothetical protein